MRLPKLRLVGVVGLLCIVTIALCGYAVYNQATKRVGLERVLSLGCKYDFDSSGALRAQAQRALINAPKLLANGTYDQAAYDRSVAGSKLLLKVIKPVDCKQRLKEL